MPKTGGAARRRAVVEEAVRAFGTRGFASTSLDEVAAAAGIRKQSLLYYFPTKEDLLEAASVRAAEIVSRSLDGALRHGPDDLSRVDRLVAGVHRLARRRPEVVGLIREVARLGPPLSDRVAAALRPLADAAAAWLEAAMDAGVVRRQNPRVALFTIYSAVVGHLTESSVKRAVMRREDRAAAQTELVAFLRAALRP